MKKVYIKPEIKKEELNINDVITTSVFDRSRWTSISVGGIDGEKFR